MSTTTRAQQLKLITDAFWRLASVGESTHDWDRYLAIVREEESEHRRFKPDHVQAGLTRNQSVQLFAVSEIFDRFIPGENGSIFTPEAKDYLHVKRSVFAACAIAHLKGLEIQAEFSHQEMAEWLKAVDYVELNRDQRKVA